MSQADAEKALETLQKFVAENFEDVGTDLAKESLKIHYGISEPRNIRGVTTESEFSNTIIGLATNALSQSDLKIKFTPPIFVHSQKDMEMLMEGVQQILTVPIEVSGVGDFSFSYLLHKRVE